MTPKKMMMMMMVMMMTLGLAIGRPTLQQHVNTACGSCQCELKGKSVFVSCKSKGLVSVPNILPRETVHLDMSFNHLTTVTRDTFRNMNAPKLRSLDVASSDIAVIEGDAFENTTLENTLRSLYLAHNHLTDTQQLVAMLKTFARLRFVDVRSNAGIDCSEMTRKLSGIIVLCDNPTSEED